ncbi:phospholipase D-like domain-containing protein [Dorea phocaeensis]|uniref:phospholipase D-like domain-containing protein n=1 Tax=Dorea phocaeensis TaxID=2040291 RepID=UPI000C781208|nr:phospholipase D-like domain-containing protein [Dorea phocaeensis]
MTEREYKKLLIDMVSIGDYKDKEEIVNLLKICNVTFEKTVAFAYSGIWDQRKEYIYLSIIPEKLVQLKSHSEYVKNVCNEIYPVSDEYMLADVIFKPGALLDYEEVSQEVLFENIQKQIIEEIRNAKYMILVAMAWFTDPVLYQELLKKKREGVLIEIVLDDNEKNRNVEFDLSEEFSTYWVSIESLYKNIMHDKFCIIDLYTVVHGTFNWTKAANYNKETISIDRNRTTAESFADEFMKLKKQGCVSLF